VITGGRTVAAGLAVAALYLGGAALSGHLSVLARRPVLDGFTSLPAYRWVNPPPALAPHNQKPFSATKDFALAGTQMKGGVVSTNDLQITVILQDGAVPAAAGRRGVRVALAPFDPAKLGGPPADLAFDGNAYRVQASYLPGNAPAGSLAVPADLALVYPADATFGVGSIKHVILTSATGKDWHVLSTTDLPQSQQASAKTSALGYFVIARSGGAGAPVRSSRSYLPILIAAAFVLLILLVTSPRVIRRLRGRGEREFEES
jgi:hypothetical protein